MQVRLKKPEIERFIDEQVKAGRFPTAEALVEDAVARMMEENVVLSKEDADGIEPSEAEIERGEFVAFDDFAAEVRRKYHNSLTMA